MTVASHGRFRQQWSHLLVILWGGAWWNISLIADEPKVPLTVYSTPLRELELVTGERLCIEEAHLDDGGLSFRWQRDNRCRLPLACLRSLANPPGWRDRPTESFVAPRQPGTPQNQGRQHVWNSTTSAAWNRNFQPALTAGEVSFAWKPVGTMTNRPVVRVSLSFDSTETTHTLPLMLESSGHVSATLPVGWTKTFSQPRPPVTNWSRVVVVWQENRCEIHLDTALLMVCQRPAGALQRLSLEAVDPSVELWIDDVVVREYRSDVAAWRAAPRRTESFDVVTLASGDQLFGTITSAQDSSPIVLDGEQGRWIGDWSEVTRIDFSRRPLPAPCFTPVNGGRWDATSLPDSPEPLFLRNLQSRGETVHHPWLGQLVWPAALPTNITPVAWGEFRWLEPDRRHLGDELRDDLSPVAPVGTLLGGEVSLDSPPVGLAWLMLDVSELEPSSPATLPTQPFLETLRGGGLRTEVFVNDELVTDLNRYLRVRSPVSDPHRVWVPILCSFWRAGRNTWSVRQQPLSPSRREFDDAEVGRIGLWITPF